MLLLLQLIIDFLIAFFLSSLFHELGHTLAAQYYGWNFLYLIAGPLRIEKKDKSTKLKFGFEQNVSLWGGVTCNTPINADLKTYDEFALILLFGPLFSLIIGSLLIPIFFLTKSYLVLLTLCMSFGMGIACILPLPIRTGLIYTDGYRYYRIKRNYNDEYILFQISSLPYINPNISYDELNELISSLTLSNDFSLQYYLHYILLQIAIESSEIEKQSIELKIINSLINNVPKSILRAYPIPNYNK